MQAPVALAERTDSKREDEHNGEQTEFDKLMETRRAKEVEYRAFRQTVKSFDDPTKGLKLRELEYFRSEQEKELRAKPELVHQEYKNEWRKFFADELRTVRQSYEDLKKGGGAPKTDAYELLNQVFEGRPGVFDADARDALADQALEEAHQAFLEETQANREANEGPRIETAELPQQKEAVSASHERPRKEYSQDLEMDVRLRDMYLSYSDAPVSDEEKKRMLEWTQGSPRATKYAESLRHLAETRNLHEIEEIAKEMIAEVKKTLARLGVSLSAYGESRSWALWDIAKQEYYAEHVEENDPRYARGNIFELPQKRDEIINRHIGWELYKAYHGGERSFVEKAKDHNYEELKMLLERQPKENGTISSFELAWIGEIVR